MRQTPAELLREALIIGLADGSTKSDLPTEVESSRTGGQTRMEPPKEALAGLVDGSATTELPNEAESVGPSGQTTAELLPTTVTPLMEIKLPEAEIAYRLSRCHSTGRENLGGKSGSLLISHCYKS